MNELIVIQPKQIGNEEINSVDARDLHSRLGVQKKFADWIKYNLTKLNLMEGTDFITVPKIGTGGKFDSLEYILTLDAGKHIAMMTHTSTAHEIRTYFIEFEKQSKKALSIPTDPILAIADALSMIRREQLSLGTKTEVLSVGLVETRTEVAKLKQNMRLESWQAHNVQKAVCRKVELWKEMYPSLNVKKAFPAIYRHLKDKFQVPKYDAIPSTEYDLAMTVITKLNMSGLAGL
jgi:phage anti-repressor protein